jgi:hypothetical protein
VSDLKKCKDEVAVVINIMTRDEDMWREGWSGGVVPHILNFDIRWSLVTSLTGSCTL